MRRHATRAIAGTFGSIAATLLLALPATPAAHAQSAMPAGQRIQVLPIEQCVHVLPERTMVLPAEQRMLVLPVEQCMLFLPAEPPVPSDVLTPDTRRNTPRWKVAIRAGFNRSNYSNDRYLDNTSLDVGEVSGETDVYGSAAAFGYGGGVEVEYPLNSVLSFAFTGEYDHVAFAGKGPVREPCVDGDEHRHLGSSLHEFRATADYARLGAAAKLSISQWYLLLGLTAGYPVATSLERTRTMTDANCFFPGSDGSREIVESGGIPSPESLHYSLRTGFGLVYQLTERLQFSPELTLDFGMSSINKSRESDLGVYSLRAVLRLEI